VTPREKKKQRTSTTLRSTLRKNLYIVTLCRKRGREVRNNYARNRDLKKQKTKEKKKKWKKKVLNIGGRGRKGGDKFREKGGYIAI